MFRCDQAIIKGPWLRQASEGAGGAPEMDAGSRSSSKGKKHAFGSFLAAFKARSCLPASTGKIGVFIKVSMKNTALRVGYLAYRAPPNVSTQTALPVLWW